MHHDLPTFNHARTLRVPSTPLALALALVLALGSAPLASHAATIVVTSAADTSPSSACTLRDAIESMNAAALVGGCANTGDAFGSNDTILFDTGVFPTDGSGTITLSGSRLAVTATDVVMDATANGNVTIDANHASGVMIDTAPAGSSTLELRHLTLTNGNVTTDDCEGFAQGGGICILFADLTLVHSTLSGNLADYGGGILGYGKITLKHSTLTGNSSVYSGGGIFGYADIVLESSTVSGNSADVGGGIASRSGSVTLTSSTLSGNLASLAGGGVHGVYTNISLTNSTLSGNSTTGKGGGLYSYAGNATLTNSTLSGNSAGESGGGIFAYAYYGTTSLEAINSIVAGNTQPDSDIVGVTPSGSGNLIGVVSNLNLGPLTDNGGTTWTMLPLAGSAAIDAVACTEAPATDQRGVSRPQGAQCDIGAVEVDLGVIFADGFEGVGPPL